MAGDIGKIYVQLSLDDKEYKQKLSDTLTSTQATARGIETSWKALGSKSAAVYDAQRRAAENAYTLIKNYSLSTESDKVRAAELSAAKIKSINEQQFGHQATLIEKLKNNWMAMAGAAIAAWMMVRKAYSFVKEIASAANDIERMSKTIGTSTDTLQKWQYAAKMSDVSSDELSTGLKLLSRNLEDASQGTGDASKYFHAMGIVVKDTQGNLKPLDIIMGQIADKFASWEDGPRKIAISLALFGRSGEALIPYLNLGREGIKKYGDELERMGGVIDKDIIKRQSEMEDVFKRWETRWTTLKFKILAAADAVVQFMSKQNEVYSGEKLAMWMTPMGGVRTTPGIGEIGPSEARFKLPIGPKVAPPEVAGKLGKGADWKQFDLEMDAYRALAKEAGQGYEIMTATPEWLNKKVIEDSIKALENEAKVKEILLERTKELYDYEFPMLKEINEMIEKGNKYYQDQVGLIEKSKDAIKEMNWDIGQTGDLSNDVEREINRLKTPIQEAVKETNLLGNAFERVFDALISGTLKGKDALKSLSLSIGKDLMSPFVKNFSKLIQDTLSNAVNKIFGNTDNTGNTSSTISSIGGQLGSTGNIYAMIVGAVFTFWEQFKKMNVTITKIFSGGKEGTGTNIGRYAGFLDPLGFILPGLYDRFFGQSANEKRREAFRAILKKTFKELGDLGFDVGDKTLFGIKIKGTGTLKQVTEIANTLYEVVTETFTNAVSKGLSMATAASGFKAFSAALRESVYDAIFEGMVNAFVQASAFQKLLAPLYQYIQESISKALKEGFDVEKWAAGAMELVKPILAAIPGLEVIYGTLSDVVKMLEKEIIGKSGGGSLTLPEDFFKQQGGMVHQTGWHYLHKGENVIPAEKTAKTFTPITAPVTVNINNPSIQSGADLDILSYRLGRKIQYQIKKPFQFG